MDYEFIKKLIEENPDACEFGPFGEGTSDMWIQKAEERLGVKFSPSYIWWLKNYNGGDIYGDEIFSIYESDFDEIPITSGGIVYKNELDRKNGFCSKNQLVFHTNNQAESYYFDLLKADKNGEYPVYVGRSIPLKGVKYGDNFLDFLEKNIKDIYIHL